MSYNAVPTIPMLVLLLVVRPNARAQGTFVNLDFESANIIPDTNSFLYPIAVAVSNALPGWTAYGGVVYPYDVVYDTIALNDAEISIHDANSPYVHVLQGSYTVFLQPNNPIATIFPAIGQIGTIPSTAHSLQFYAGGIPQVSFGGQQLGLVTLAATPNYGIFAADITAFAGQTGELRFWGESSIDNITLSSQAIPEPNCGTVLLPGMLAAGLSRRKWTG